MQSPSSNQIRCFPRTRGDGPYAGYVHYRLDVFPPHARGWTRLVGRRRTGREVSPARAGMDLVNVGLPSFALGFPRTRGDGPCVGQRQIATTLGISQAAVSKILTRVDERALRDLTAAVARQKAAQTRVLDHLQAEALQAWEHSKAETTRRRQRQSHAEGRGPGTSVELTVETRHGDPRYLEVVLRTLADRRKLWGLDAPQQVEVRATRNPYADLDEAALRETLADQQRLLQPASDPPTPAMPTEVSDVH